jgi:Protein of unknown function (DUF1236)
MRSKLLIMSTAALLAGTLAAASQSVQPGGGAPEKGKPESSSPATKSNPGTRPQTQGQAERGQETQKGKTPAQAERGPDNAKDNLKGKTEGQAERVQDNAKDNPKSKTPGQAERDQDKQKSQGQAREQDEKKGQTEGQAQRDQDKRPGQAQNPGEQDRVQGAREGQKSGNTTVSFTTEQRSKIRETVFKEKDAPRMSKVDFSLNVGIAVPRTVHIVEVPEVIIDIHPEWRGYRYFIVNDEVVIVEPDTLKIVAIIDV